MSHDLQVIRYDPETKVWEGDGLGTGTGAGVGVGSGLDGLLGEGFGGFGLLGLGFTLGVGGVGGFNTSISPKFAFRANNSN